MHFKLFQLYVDDLDVWLILKKLAQVVFFFKAENKFTLGNFVKV